MRRSFFIMAIAALATFAPNWVLADDQGVAKAVVTRLGNLQKSGELKNFDINVDVEEGRVWVQGRVATDEQQQLVLEAVRRVTDVKLVVNDLKIADRDTAEVAVEPVVQTPAAPVAPEVALPAPPQLAPIEPASVEVAEVAPVTPQAVQTVAIGSGVVVQPASTVNVAPVPVAAVPVAAAPVAVQARPAVARSARRAPGAPVAFAASRRYTQAQPASAAMGHGVAPVRHDQPNMPGYAWPSYAAHPNYAAVTYPKQYSPTAWPYIGPFYPYPQVPLGWRKVTLEWDDGWWMLDFKSK